MFDLLLKWLAKPSGKYSDGVAMFELLASTDIRRKYLDFFREVKQPVQHDIHFCMLINKLSDIARKMRANPSAFDHVQILVKPKPAQDLSQGVGESEFISVDQMPEDIRALYVRNRELTPLMASLHAQMADPHLSKTKRKSLVAELSAFDDERRANWEAVQLWCDGKEIASVQAPPKQVFENTLSEGAAIARRIETLKDNIAKAKATIAKATREQIRQNATHRLQRYEKELSELSLKIS